MERKVAVQKNWQMRRGLFLMQVAPYILEWLLKGNAMSYTVCNAVQLLYRVTCCVPIRNVRAPD